MTNTNLVKLTTVLDCPAGAERGGGGVGRGGVELIWHWVRWRD